MWIYPHSFPQLPQPYPQIVDKACFHSVDFIYYKDVYAMISNRIER
ncbi:hypothetical protein J2S19_003436 [Metabacillus malikii]|uniref:Uncharacterized protein n=1 Tax=Metabacillus malikii TaxID=1504265 RepID=A0ABT9ZIR3_9BACI|nr:hypothetical protein [Metabacillus malikii]